MSFDSTPIPLPPPTGRAGQLVRHYGMQLIPDEGAWFAAHHVSPARIAAAALPARFAGGGDRPLGSSIFALVTVRDFSALHRLRSEETWHFYEGTPLELLLLYPDGHDACLCLGSDSLCGQLPQVTVPAGVWMGARLRLDAGNDPEPYALFGCTVSPGFHETDFEPGWRDHLVAAYPARADLIHALTRTEFACRPIERARAVDEPRAGDGAADAPLRQIGMDPGTVFGAAEVPEIELGPGVTIRELVGRGGQVRSDALSFARFRLAPRRNSGWSRYTAGDEFFVILAGKGEAAVGALRWPVAEGAVVVVRRGEVHALTAASDSELEFLTILSPAFDSAHFSAESSSPSDLARSAV